MTRPSKSRTKSALPSPLCIHTIVPVDFVSVRALHSQPHPTCTGCRGYLPTQKQARETLALDLRGHGTNLIAPESTATTGITAANPVPAGDDCVDDGLLSPSRQERCATAGATVVGKRARTRTMTRALSSSRVEGGEESGGATNPSKPPPFRAKRSSTVQEARTAVVTNQVPRIMLQ